MPNLNHGFLFLWVLVLMPVGAWGNSVWDGWIYKNAPYMNWFPEGTVDQESAVLLEPLGEGSGPRIKFSTSTGKTAVCLYSCADFYYRNNSITCWNCAFADCEQWSFANVCTRCPEEYVTSTSPAMRLPADNPQYHDVRDCALPAGTIASDDTGTFTVTADCHYVN